MAKKDKTPYNKNGIYVNCKKLSGISSAIAAKSELTIDINDCINQSLGNAANMEKDTIALLKDICTNNFSEMIDSTTALLNAIVTDFSTKDKSLSIRPDRIES